MSIFVETNKKLHLCEDGIIFCPIHPQSESMSNYPITTIRNYYPIEYSHMMSNVKDGIDRGEIIFSDIGDNETVVWGCCHNAYNVSYKLDWIESALKGIRKMRLHDKNTIFFPGLGYYEEDGIDQEDVLKLVHDYLGDGRYNVRFLSHY